MKLFYREYGSGNSLLILHGLFGLSDHWINIAKALSKDYRVIIPDLRNHGQSPHDTGMNYAVMVEDILELLSDLNISKTTILGHSMGGKLAMSLALQAPEFVGKLVIGDVGVKKISLSPEILSIVFIMESVLPEEFHSRNELISTLNMSGVVKEIVLKNLRQGAGGRLNWKPNVPALLNNLENIATEIVSDKTFNGETLFLRGEHSGYILPEDIAVIGECFPNSRFITIENAGHWLQTDNPEMFLFHVQKFIKIDPSPGSFVNPNLI